MKLEIPDGDLCNSDDACMFLDVDFMYNEAYCSLFDKRLRGDLKYGSLEPETIRKCDRCPKGAK